VRPVTAAGYHGSIVRALLCHSEATGGVAVARRRAVADV
jgi:hypothetical protein